MISNACIFLIVIELVILIFILKKGRKITYNTQRVVVISRKILGQIFYIGLVGVFLFIYFYFTDIEILDDKILPSLLSVLIFHLVNFISRCIYICVYSKLRNYIVEVEKIDSEYIYRVALISLIVSYFNNTLFTTVMLTCFLESIIFEFEEIINLNEIKNSKEIRENLKKIKMNIIKRIKNIKIFSEKTFLALYILIPFLLLSILRWEYVLILYFFVLIIILCFFQIMNALKNKK